MNKKERAVSNTERVARFYIEHCLEIAAWNYASPPCRRALREAKMYVNPKDGVAISAATLIATLRSMKAAGWKFWSLHDISKAKPGGDGRTWFEYAEEAEKPPPVYEQLARERWLRARSQHN